MCHKLHPKQRGGPFNANLIKPNLIIIYEYPLKCHSFEFNSDHLNCALFPIDSQPFGPGILAKKEEEEEPNLLNPSPNVNAHFQRICIPSLHNYSCCIFLKFTPKGILPFCPSAHAFERFPQHVLLGHALEVCGWE
jgi:hypothetical protein